MRYFIDTDGDSKTYIIPTEKEKEWEKYLELLEDGEYHPVPDFAKKIEGGRLYFDNPFMDGKLLFNMTLKAKIDNPSIYTTFHKEWDYPNGNLEVKKGYIIRGSIFNIDSIDGLDRIVFQTNEFVPFPYIHVDSDNWEVEK